MQVHAQESQESIGNENKRFYAFCEHFKDIILCLLEYLLPLAFIYFKTFKYSKHPHIRTHNFRGQTDCVLIYRMLSEKSASGCS